MRLFSTWAERYLQPLADTLGEKQAAERISYRVPDLKSPAARARYERLQAPVELEPLIVPNVHSCGTVHPHGVKELSHPERDVYLVGMKSYGRAPTFLAMTGYEQTRSIAAALAGDREAAERVELILPETGVRGGAGLFDELSAEQPGESGGCCAAPAAPAT
ncbi:hypothetical protein STRAU_7366 [Streptomyces aurantiacus JA 4570]|uniref:Uncharacterized protein n=1 Tax=Streptomyces aurantiacus JA 4570 TaxID=1286094 RepID=S4ADN6_9ACTN|nr:hypothetical protein STRAU_7366 [Streptomyces aurantiacus JA 4570]